MEKNQCNIIRDLIPLCIDNIASEDSEVLVKDHIAKCQECQKEFEAAGKNIVVNKISMKGPLEKIRKSIFRKKVIISIIAGFSVLIVMSGVFYFLTGYDIKYKTSEIEKFIYVEEDSYGNVEIGIEGTDYYCFYSARDDESSGEVFNLSYTIWSRYFSKNYSKKVLYEFEKNGKIDYVKYSDFEINFGSESFITEKPGSKMIWEE